MKKKHWLNGKQWQKWVVSENTFMFEWDQVSMMKVEHLHWLILQSQNYSLLIFATFTLIWGLVRWPRWPSDRGRMGHRSRRTCRRDNCLRCHILCGSCCAALGHWGSRSWRSSQNRQSRIESEPCNTEENRARTRIPSLHRRRGSKRSRPRNHRPWWFHVDSIGFNLMGLLDWFECNWLVDWRKRER